MTKNPIYAFIARDVDALEHNAKTQYKFNRFWAIFWFGQMFLLPLLIWLAPKVWLGIEFFYVTEASLWANFATHFGAMSSALAADNTSDVIDDVQDDVQDIAEVAQKLHPTLYPLDASN